jgi:hypothetical protein
MFGDAKLAKRLAEVEESLRRIEHAFKMLQVEWTETYDKFRQLHWRVAKRANQLEKAAEESAAADTQSPPNDAAVADSSNGYTPKQQQTQLEILARRNRRHAEPRNGGG